MPSAETPLAIPLPNAKGFVQKRRLQSIDSDVDKRPKRAPKAQKKTKAHDGTDDYVSMVSWKARSTRSFMSLTADRTSETAVAWLDGLLAHYRV